MISTTYKMHWLLLTVISVVCVNAVAEVTCPSKCRCNQYKSITCTGITNEELLRMKFPLEYVELKLENNQLSEFPPKENFVNNSFTTISLSGNKFRAIPDFPDTVTDVRLKNNSLSGEIMSSNFTTWIRNAKSIDLSENKITGIQAHAFTASTQLRYLSLSHNQIKHLHRDAFANLTAVEYLFLKGNLISTLTSGLFDGMKKLETLLLNKNKLTSIRADVFTNVSLESLFLNKNRISYIAPGSFGNELLDIHLSDNLLTAISTNWYVNVSAQELWGRLKMEGNEFNCSCLLFNATKELVKNKKSVAAHCYDKQNIKKDYIYVLKGCHKLGACSNDGESFTCTCTKDFKGKTCKTPKTLCDYSPCHHNATCTDQMTKNSAPDEFSCNCTRGYKGKTCDTINSGSSFKSLHFIGHFYFCVLLAKCILL